MDLAGAATDRSGTDRFVRDKAGDARSCIATEASRHEALGTNSRRAQREVGGQQSDSSTNAATQARAGQDQHIRPQARRRQWPK